MSSRSRHCLWHHRLNTDMELCRRTQELTDAPVSYGLIPKSDWYQPDWIEEDKAKAAREKMVKENVIYGGSVP